MKRVIKASINNKCTSRNWKDIISYIESLGYVVDSYSKVSPDHWVICYKDGYEFEAEVTRYSNGEFEILDENIRTVGPSYSSEEQDENSRYVQLDSKQVEDSDGFLTDYTLYEDTENEKYICIFGDNDMYNPMNTEPDVEFDAYDEAIEWFSNYNGFYDEEDEY